jgi:hypothetical protein
LKNEAETTRSSFFSGGFANKQQAVLLLVSLVILGISLLNWGKESVLNGLRKHARKPENILVIANSVATFSDPLPGNFVWQSGVSLLFSKSLTAQDNNRFMIITIVSNDKITSGFGPLDKCLQIGTELGNNALAREWKQTGAGTMPVQGHDLLYQTGEVTLSTHKVGEFRGSISLKDKSINIDAFGQIDKPFDLSQLQSFLDGVKEFK